MMVFLHGNAWTRQNMWLTFILIKPSNTVQCWAGDQGEAGESSWDQEDNFQNGGNQEV